MLNKPYAIEFWINWLLVFYGLFITAIGGGDIYPVAFMTLFGIGLGMSYVRYRVASCKERNICPQGDENDDDR